MSTTAQVLLILPLSLMPAVATAAARVTQCPLGQHWVRAHHRRAYVRADGVMVSAADVQAHCSVNPPAYSTWKTRLSNVVPKSWPNGY
jgi:hypothetical protein